MVPSSETAKDITGWIPVANATVTLTDSEGVTHTVTTDEDGYYTFTDITVNANTIITATATVDGNTVIIKDIIPQAVAATEDYDTGTADAESTALALIVEELLEQELDPEDINLEEIQDSDNFTAVVEQVSTVLAENGNVTTDPGVTETVSNAAEEINPPAYTPPEPSPEPSPEPEYTPPPVTPKTYTITASADLGGSISPSGDITVNQGSDKTFTITPDSVFYGIKNVLVDGSSVGVVPPDTFTYTFNNVTKDHAIHADFKLLGRVYNQTQETYHDTIQAAVKKAFAGDTILVSPWTYKPEEPGSPEPIGIDIDKDDLTLKAVGATEDTIIDVSATEIGIVIHANGVTVEGFTVNGGGIAHHAIQVVWGEWEPGVLEGVSILHNIITGTTDAAISIYGANSPITGVTISGNTIDNCKYGIRVGNGVSDTTISNNTITNSTQDTSDWGALTFCGKISGLTVSGNEISSNEKLNGIYLGSGTYDGIVVKNNTISNNLGGVLIDDDDPTNLAINDNNIIGNDFGIKANDGVTVDAKDNWWGAASGPDPEGEGNAVIGNEVDFDPWSPVPYPY